MSIGKHIELLCMACPILTPVPPMHTAHTCIQHTQIESFRSIMFPNEDELHPCHPHNLLHPEPILPGMPLPVPCMYTITDVHPCHSSPGWTTCDGQYAHAQQSCAGHAACWRTSRCSCGASSLPNPHCAHLTHLPTITHHFNMFLYTCPHSCCSLPISTHYNIITCHMTFAMSFLLGQMG